MKENADDGTAVLDAQAALSLVKSGIATPFPAMYFSVGTALSLAATILLPFFLSWVVIPIGVLATLLCYMITRVLTMRAALQELLGNGQQSREAMEAVYDRLVAHDLLRATRWTN